MITIRDLTYRIDGKTLFESASASVPPGTTVGVVGRNGTGKTTLFRLIRGELSAESGGVDIPKQARLGGVAQEAPASDQSLLETVLVADEERTALLAQAEIATDAEDIATIQTRLADIGAHSAEARAASILQGLGFDSKTQMRACAEFSGGWRMRVALAAVLFSAPDLLLLDEPTNYLDLEGAVWLENFLARYPYSCLVISHDRELLNRSVRGILHLQDAKLDFYKGGYDTFDATRRARLEQQVAAKRKQDAQREHIQSFVDRFRAKATKARQAQSRLKMLERMQPIAAISENAVTGFNFKSPDELSPPLIAVEGGTIGYDGQAVLERMNFRVDQDDRIALLGANGQGKSTLSKLIGGRLALMDGQQTRSRKLRIGYFAQHQLDELRPAETPLQHIAREFPDELPTKHRARLGAAGFGADLADLEVRRLSGGQKARLLMMLATLDAPHILILDEPTNHLDIESREALVHALNDFGGAVILVSHDSHLVETVADRLWLVNDARVAPFDGDMSDYKRLLLSQRGAPGPQSKEKKAPKADSATKATSKPKPKARKSVNALTQDVARCEERVEAVAAMLEKLDLRLADTALYENSSAVEVEKLRAKREEIVQAHEKAEALWLLALEELELAQSAVS